MLSLDRPSEQDPHVVVLQGKPIDRLGLLMLTARNESTFDARHEIVAERSVGVIELGMSAQLLHRELPHRVEHPKPRFARCDLERLDEAAVHQRRDQVECLIRSGGISEHGTR